MVALRPGKGRGIRFSPKIIDFRKFLAFNNKEASIVST
jgi:hypothetical protein